MKEFRANVFAALTNTDLTEGRGGEVVLAYFTNKPAAEKATRGRGVMGTDGHVEKRTIHIQVFGTYAEYENAKKKDLREAALAKLTREEQEMLGIAEDVENRY